MTVEATTRADAEAIGNRQGLMVDLVSEILSPITPSENTPPPSMFPAPKAPEYAGLIIGSRICNVLGAVMIIAGVVTMFAAFTYESRRVEVGAAGGSMLITGAFWFIASAVLNALRDIARNSFR